MRQTSPGSGVAVERGSPERRCTYPRNSAKIQWKVVAALACGLLLSGCLVPQDDGPLPVIPKTKNHAPRILDNTIDPAQELTVTVGTKCPQKIFKAKGSSDDLADG